MKPTAQTDEQVVFRPGFRDLVVTSDAGYFGITISNESPAVVDNVKPGGPADVSGLRKGDKIVSVNGSDVTGMSHKAVVELIRSHASVTLRVFSTLPKMVDAKRSSVSVEENPLNHVFIEPTKSLLVAQNSSASMKALAHSLPMEPPHIEQDAPDSSSSGGVFSKAVKRWSTFHGPSKESEKKAGKKNKKDQARKTTQVVADLISAPVAVNLQEETYHTKLATLQQYYLTLKSSSKDPAQSAQLRKIEEEIAKLQTFLHPQIVNNGVPQTLAQNGNSTSSLTSTLISHDDDTSSNTRTSGVSVPDESDEGTELVFESIEGAKQRLKQSQSDFPPSLIEPETDNGFLGPSRVRGSASLNDLAEEPSSISENGSPKVDEEDKALDDRSMRSASSGILSSHIDSSQHSGTGSGKTSSVADNLNSKSRLKMMNRLKQKRSSSSDDVRLRTNEQENNLPRNETSDSQLVGRSGEVDEVESVAEGEETEPKANDSTLVGDEDFINSLMNPNGVNAVSDFQQRRPVNIPILSFDEEENGHNQQQQQQQQSTTGPKFQPILAMESPNDHESVDVLRHQSTASYASHPAFKDASSLCRSPSHCLIVLRFMYTRDTQSSLLFYLISNKYFDTRIIHPKGDAGIKEKMSWAVELHSAFTAQNAPWPIPDMLEASRQPADMSFRNGNVGYDRIDSFFKEARLVCERKVNEELKLFQAGVTQGFGDHYGVNHLLDSNTTLDQLLDKIWMQHIEQLRREDAEKSRVLLSALCTVFSLFQCRPTPYERWFGKLFCEPIRKLKKPESKKAKGHLCSDFIYTTYPVNCAYCQKTLFGPNHQGMRCDGCNLDFHEACLLHLTTECAKRRTKIFSTMGKSSGMRISEQLNSAHDLMVEINERNGSPELDNNNNNNNNNARSASPMPSSMISSTANLEQSPGLEPVLTASDEDLADDVNESDPSTCYHKSHQRQITGREQSRQCAIHELWRIELYHVYKLRLLHDQVILKIHHSNEPSWSEAMRALFPNLPRLIQEHSYFYNALKERHQKQCPIQTVGDILLDVVSGDRYQDFVNVVAECLEAQAEHDKLWQKLRSERRFTEFIGEIERQSRLIRKRRQVESLKVAEMQLIARYPLLIDGIIKYSDDEQERAALKEARAKFAQIPDEVNTRVGKAEKRQQKRELEENLVIIDKERLVTAFPYLESPKTELGELVHCGDLSWKLPTMGVPVRVFLFSRGVVLICLRRGNSLELKMHTIGTPAAPDRPDSNVIVQGNSTFHQVAPQKFVPAVEFCPVIEIGPKTTINGTREAMSKERIDIRPDKSEVKLGTPVYRFCFVGAGPRDASSEWDEWTHYLTQIQTGQPITRFKPAPKPSLLATQSVPILGASPQPPVSSTVVASHSLLGQHLSSSSITDQINLSVPDGPPLPGFSTPEPSTASTTTAPNEQQPQTDSPQSPQTTTTGETNISPVIITTTPTTTIPSIEQRVSDQQNNSDNNNNEVLDTELEADQKQALDSFIFSEGTDNNNNTGTANDSEVSGEEAPSGGSGDEPQSSSSVPPAMPTSSPINISTNDPLLTPEFVTLFGFKDARELAHFGSFYLQKPLSHSPLSRTTSPKFSFPTIGALMSPKQPTELHEHLLCLSLEINKLASLALTKVNNTATTTSHYGTPNTSASRVSFSPTTAQQTSTNGSDVEQVEQTVAALRRRMEVIVQMSGRSQRSSITSSEISSTSEPHQPPIPL